MVEGERQPIRLKDFQPRQEGETDQEWSARVWRAVQDNQRVVGACIGRWIRRNRGEDMADFGQEALILAHRILSDPRYREGGASLSTWLCSGLRLAFQHLRRKVRGERCTHRRGEKVVWHRKAKPIPEDFDVVESGGNIGDLLPRIEGALRCAIEEAELSPIQRTTLEARLLDGLLLKEVGDRIQRSRERVRQIEEGAMARLRDSLKRTPAGRRLEELFDRIEEARA